ncbi:MAG: hypothetical protein R3C17_04765 [Planctomycetaceae bacterium]
MLIRSITSALKSSHQPTARVNLSQIAALKAGLGTHPQSPTATNWGLVKSVGKLVSVVAGQLQRIHELHFLRVTLTSLAAW